MPLIKLEVARYLPPYLHKKDLASMVHSKRFLGAVDFVFVDAVLLGVGRSWQLGYGTGRIRWRRVSASGGGFFCADGLGGSCF